MKRFLIPLLAAFALTSYANAGIPNRFKGKWMKWGSGKVSTIYVDTEDIELKGNKLRFYVRRKLLPHITPNPNTLENWEGKARIDCENFTQKISVYVGGLAGYRSDPTTAIKKEFFTYKFAENFCFLTGVDGYTPEPNPSLLVQKIIKTIQSKSIKKNPRIRKVTCNSPVWKKKPRCNQ